jgi:hypothetical protein
LNWSVPASVLPGDSPYTIADVDDGQYRVGITPVYADGRRCSEVTLDTTVCGTVTSFSSVFSGGDITVTYSATSEKVRVIINYPNGGQFSQIYTTGASIVITPPADLFGVFSLTMQPVCSSSTGWFGASTAPSIVEVTPAANSTIVNNTSYILTNLKVWYVGVDNLKVLIATVPALAVGGNLSIYVGDGFYNSFGIQIDTGTIGQGNLTTDTGVTVGVVSDGTQIEFLNVDASGGINISLLDSSP